MAWREITAADVEAHLNAGELAEYRKHSVEHDDPLPVLIEDVTQLVRGYVGVRYPLGSRGIPDELRVPSIDLVIHRLAKRVTRAGEDDADRRAAAEAATRLLDAVREGGFAIAPEAASTATVTAAAGGYGSDPRFQSPPYPTES